MYPHQSICLADHLCCYSEKVIRPTPAVCSVDAEPDDLGGAGEISDGGGGGCIRPESWRYWCLKWFKFCVCDKQSELLCWRCEGEEEDAIVAACNAISTSPVMPWQAQSAAAASAYLFWLLPSSPTDVGSCKPFCLNCVNGPTAGAACAGQLEGGRGFVYKQRLELSIKSKGDEW